MLPSDFRPNSPLNHSRSKKNEATGRRNARWATVKGTRQDAQRELTRLLAAVDSGTLPEPSKATVAEYLREWFDNDHDLAPKTRERYRELAELQIIPHLGNEVLHASSAAQSRKVERNPCEVNSP
jgi:hypothetical protein